MRNKNVKIILIILFIIVCIVIAFSIDSYRMRKNLPVLFSTWGKKYAPMVNIENHNLSGNETNSLLELVVTYSNKNEIIKITTGELEGKYDYDIFYYGIESVSIKHENNTIDFIEALVNKTVSMEQIMQQVKNDVSEGKAIEDVYRDGGTKLYIYNKYSIIKGNSLDGNKNVYIGIPSMILDDVT